MQSVTLKDINELLKDASEPLLERVLGYIEGLLNDESMKFELSEDQIESLRKIKARDYSEHTDIKVFLHEMNGKYGI